MPAHRKNPPFKANVNHKVNTINTLPRETRPTRSPLVPSKSRKASQEPFAPSDFSVEIGGHSAFSLGDSKEEARG
ncbi:MAG: hypothetical protein ABSH47_18010 [Bryobacteraceae bacterium]|jgi:hypothetical protein